MNAESDTQRSFRHSKFIVPLSLHRLLVNWLSRPLAVCLAPVMVCTLFLALQEQQIGMFLKIGTSIALLCATGWTLLQIARTPAEVSFRNDRVLIKTFLETSLRPDSEKWHYVIDVKMIDHNQTPAVMAITYGHTSFEFRKNEWAHFQSLTQLLIKSRQHYENKVGASAT